MRSYKGRWKVVHIKKEECKDRGHTVCEDRSDRAGLPMERDLREYMLMPQGREIDKPLYRFER